MLLLVLPAGFFVYRFFKPPVIVDSAAAVASAAPVAGAPAINSRPAVDDTWRLVGYYLKGDTTVFIVEGVGGRIRQFINPPKFQIAGLDSAVELPEGGFATNWNSVSKEKNEVLP